MENDILKQRERVRNNVLESFLGSNEIEKGGGNKHYFSTKERENLAKKGEALPDGSFPIRNTQDLKDAIKSVGRAKNPERAKRWIKRRARELGKEDLLPDTWKAEDYEILDFEEMTLQKAEQLLLGDDIDIDLFEKAHVHGEVHPNGKWYWNSQANKGKGDWRVIKKKEGIKEKQTKTGDGEKIKSREEFPTVHSLINKLSGRAEGILYHPNGERASADSIVQHIYNSRNKLASLLDVKGASGEKIDRTDMTDDKVAGSYAVVKNDQTGKYELLTFKESDKEAKEESKLDTGKTTDINKVKRQYDKLVERYNKGEDVLKQLNDAEEYLGLPKTTKQTSTERESNVSLNDFPVLKTQDVCKNLILDSAKKIKGIYDNLVKNNEIDSYELEVNPYNLGYNLQVIPKNKKVFDKEKNREKTIYFNPLSLSIEPDVFINQDFKKGYKSKIDLYISGTGGENPSVHKTIPVSKDSIDNVYSTIKKEIETYLKNFKLVSY